MKEKVVESYHKIYLRYAHMLLCFAEKYVSSFHSEDIVHDVFLKLWDKQIFLLPEDEIKKILYVSVRNSCIDHLRKSALEQKYIDKRRILLKIEELEYFESLDNHLVDKELLNKLMQCIDELPKQRRIIFKMSYFEDLKASEIASRLDISVRTVENHLYRALLFLRKKCFSYILLLCACLFSNYYH